MAVINLEMPAPGDEVAGKYLIERVLGQGGMGTVFAARNTLTGKRVAIKWLLPEHSGQVIRQRLLAEARLASSVEHPNVVDVYDVGEHRGGLFLVMEYLPGRPLSELLLERGRLDPHELIALLVPALRGVHAAHLAGVVHRDLKPENIILSELEGHVVPKVVDFGVSKATGASSLPDSSLTRPGALVGTPHYMALEQVDGSSDVDARTDVYAFGVLLYRGLTGSYPFDGGNLGEVILKLGTRDAAPMRSLRPELPEELDAIVLRALSRDRNARFESAEELARQLMPFAKWSEGGGATSWHGSLPAGSVSFHSVVAHVAPVNTLDRSGIAPLVTVAGGRRVGRDRRTLAVSVALLLTLLGVGVQLMRGDAELAQAGDSAAKVELSHAQPGAADTARANSTAPHHELALPVLNVVQATPDSAVQAPSKTPEQGSAEPAAVGSHPVDVHATNPSVSSTRPVLAVLGSKRAAERKQARALERARKREARALIPGERTHGLSPADF